MKLVIELLSTMDVPINRLNDLSWLACNLGVRNKDHEAMRLIKRDLR